MAAAVLSYSLLNTTRSLLWASCLMTTTICFLYNLIAWRSTQDASHLLLQRWPTTSYHIDWVAYSGRRQLTGRNPQIFWTFSAIMIGFAVMFAECKVHQYLIWSRNRHVPFNANVSHFVNLFEKRFWNMFVFQMKGLLAFDFGATVAPYPPFASKWVYLRPCVSHHHGETTPICRPISHPTPLFVSDPGLSTSCWGRFNCHKRPLQVINKGLQWRFSALLNWFLASEGNSTRAFNLDSHKRSFQLTCLIFDALFRLDFELFIALSQENFERLFKKNACVKPACCFVPSHCSLHCFGVFSWFNCSTAGWKSSLPTNTLPKGTTITKATSLQ